MVMTSEALPDSRLQRSTIGDVKVQWPVIESDGLVKTITLMLQPVYCINCGCSKGYVPRGLFSWVTFLCDPCSEKHGAAAAIAPHSDSDFWATVREEMVKSYGHGLTQEQLVRLAEHGGLSQALRLLERESPYKHLK